MLGFREAVPILLRSRFAVLFLVLLLTLIAALAEAGTPADLIVMITYPDTDYTLGSTATVSIHVLDADGYADADRLEVEVGTGDLMVPAKRVGTGLYLVTFVMNATEAAPDGFFVDATVWKDGRSATGSTSIVLSDYPQLELAVMVEDPSDVHPSPGQTVEFTVRATCLGRYVDPDEGTLAAFVPDSPDPDIPLTLVRQDTGIYRGSFAIPVERDIYSSFDITACGKLTIDRLASEAKAYERLQVRVLDVWYGCVRQGPVGASVDIFVYDLSCNPASGAELSLHSWYRRADGEQIESWHDMTCGDDGRARLELEYVNVSSINPAILIKGNASFRGRAQGVFGMIPVDCTVPETEERGGLRLTPVGGIYLPAGVEYNLTCIATLDRVPFAGQCLSGGIFGEHDVYWNGTVMTGADGSLTIRLTTPATRMAFEGEEPIWPVIGAWVNGTFQYAWGMHELRVRDHVETWSSLAGGCPTTRLEPSWGPGDGEFGLALRTSGADGIDEGVDLLWGIGELGGGWERLYACMDSGQNFATSGAPLDASWEDGCYRACLVIPPFVPPGTNVYIIGIVDMNDRLPFERRYAYIANLSEALRNEPPSVSIDSPANGSVMHGAVTISGIASDDRGVETVMVRFDGGEWVSARGTTDWWLPLPQEGLSDGRHTLEAVGFDGLALSPVEKVEFEYVHSVREEEGGHLALWLIIVVIAALVGAALIRKSRRMPHR